MTWPLGEKRRRRNSESFEFDAREIPLGILDISTELVKADDALTEHVVFRVSVLTSSDRIEFRDYASMDEATKAANALTQARFEARLREFTQRLGRLNRGSTAPIACVKAAGWLDNLALVLPTRIVNEDLGDFLEDINRRGLHGQSSFKIYLRTTAATFWLIANAVGYLVRTVVARKSA
jgi:hypothetical protein